MLLTYFNGNIIDITQLAYWMKLKYWINEEQLRKPDHAKELKLRSFNHFIPIPLHLTQSYCHHLDPVSLDTSHTLASHAPLFQPCPCHTFGMLWVTLMRYGHKGSYQRAWVMISKTLYLRCSVLSNVVANQQLPIAFLLNRGQWFLFRSWYHPPLHTCNSYFCADLLFV